MVMGWSPITKGELLGGDDKGSVGMNRGVCGFFLFFISLAPADQVLITKESIEVGDHPLPCVITFQLQWMRRRGGEATINAGYCKIPNDRDNADSLIEFANAL